MLSNICSDWNHLFVQHLATQHHGSVIIVEKGNEAKDKTTKSVTISCHDGILFPTKELDQFDLFGAFTNKNCDGALLLKNDDNTYDLVYIEMKSRFDLKKIYEAKYQIIESRIKMKPLLKMSVSFNQISIKNVFGIIVTLELDEDQKNWWSKRQLLPEKDWEFGDRLLQFKKVVAPTKCKKELDFPDNMTFCIAFSSNENCSIDYRVFTP